MGKSTDDWIIANINYNPDSGVFTKIKTGKQIGSFTRRYGRYILGGKQFYLARMAVLIMTGSWPDGEVDHIDGNPSNNSWSNLRVCTRDENAKNRRAYKTNKLGVKGVWCTKYKGSTYYLSKIQVDGKPVYLGSFKTVEEASEAYNQAVVKHHGEFASLSVI